MKVKKKSIEKDCSTPLFSETTRLSNGSSKDTNKSEDACIRRNCNKIKMSKTDGALFCSSLCIIEYTAEYLNKVIEGQKIKFYDTLSRTVKVYSSGSKISKSDIDRINLIFIKKPYYRFYDQNEQKMSQPVSKTVGKILTKKNDEQKKCIKIDVKVKNNNTYSKTDAKRIVSDGRITGELRKTAIHSLTDALSMRLEESNDPLIKNQNSKESLKDMVKDIEEKMYIFFEIKTLININQNIVLSVLI